MALYTMLATVEALFCISIAVIAKRFADTVNPEAGGLSGLKTSPRAQLLSDAVHNIEELFAPEPEVRVFPGQA